MATNGEPEMHVLSRAELRRITQSVAASRILHFSERQGSPSATIPDSVSQFSTASQTPVKRSTRRSNVTKAGDAQAADARDSVVDLAVELTENDVGASVSLSSSTAGEAVFDRPLRLSAPAFLRSGVPPLKDPPSSHSLAQRVTALMRGCHALPAHWSGTEDVDHTVKLRDAVERSRAALRSGDLMAAAKAEVCIGSIQYNGGNWELALRSFSRAAGHYAATGDQQGLAYAHNVMGVVSFYLGESKSALVHDRKMESLCGSYGKAVALINLGMAYSSLGNYEFARQALQDGMQNAKSCDAKFLECAARANYGVVQLREGDLRGAAESMEDCLQTFSVAGNRSGACVCLLLLSEIYLLVNDFAHALFYAEQATAVGIQAERSDVIELARVTVGVCRGCMASAEVMTSIAIEMGGTVDASDVVDRM